MRSRRAQVRRVRRSPRLGVERLESFEAANNLLPVFGALAGSVALAATMPNPADPIPVTMNTTVDDSTAAPDLTALDPPTEEAVAANDQFFVALANDPSGVSSLTLAPVNFDPLAPQQPTDGLTGDPASTPTGGNGAFANPLSSNPQGQAAQGGAASTNTPQMPTVNANASSGGPNAPATAPAGPTGLVNGAGDTGGTGAATPSPGGATPVMGTPATTAAPVHSGHGGIAPAINLPPPQPTVQFTQTLYLTPEGEQTLLTASLSTPSTQTVTVQYNTANGTAQAGVDYTTTNGTLTFTPGTTTQTITVPGLDDGGTGESAEQFMVSLSNPSNATLGSANTATVSIYEGGGGSQPTVQFSQSTFTANEGSQINLPITLSTATNQTVFVQYATMNGTAQAGVDYGTTTGTLPFPANTTQEFITVPVLDDNGTGESGENFSVALSNPSNATLGTPSTATVNITEDNDGGGSPGVTLTNPGNQSGAEGNNVSLQLQATDSFGDPITYGATNLPAGLTLDTGSGLISGTLAYSDAETPGGNYPITLTAYDNHGYSASQNLTWTIADTQVAPTLTNPGDQSNREGDPVFLPLSATDPDGDPLTYSATGLPAGLNLNPTTGVIAGIIQSGDGTHSPYAVTVTTSDGTLYNSQSFNWIVPHLQIDPLADQSNLLGDSVSVPVNAWSYSGQPLTYSATGLPGGVSLNAQTGLLSGTIANTDSVTTPYSVTITATDGVDPASTTFAWTLSDLAITNPGDQTNAEGDNVALPISVQDNNPNAVITYSATGLPSGLAINPQTGLIAGTVANLDSNFSPYSVTVNATDGISTSSETFNWTISHVLLTDPGDQINAPNDVVSLPIQASDPDHDALTYGVSGLPTGLSINSSTGLISGTIASGDGSGSPYAVTLTASDGMHTATDTITWNISSGVVMVTNPGTQNSAEGATISLPIIASDTNGDVLAYTATGLPAGLQIDYRSGIIAGTMDSAAAETQGGVYAVTVLADNGQGGTGSTAFTWNVSHVNQAPTLDPIDNQVDQQGDIVSLPVNGYDADGDTVT